MNIREAYCRLKEKQRMMIEYRNFFSSEDIEANGMAILALERLAPKKPKNYITPFPNCIAADCPNCGFNFGFNSCLNFCQNCGQAIDFNVVEHSCTTCGSYFGTCKALNKGELKGCIMWTEDKKNDK